MIDGLYQRLVDRSQGFCECGCGKSVRARREIDHQFGRPPRADESMETCWVLTPECHFMKTRNSPTVTFWLERFRDHCKRYGYGESQQRAEARIFYADTRRAFARGALR